MKKLLCILLIAILPIPAHAWSEGGHHIIALMAFDLLNNQEQTKLLAKLEKHPRYKEDFEPPEKLPNDSEVARWRVGRAGQISPPLDMLQRLLSMRIRIG